MVGKLIVGKVNQSYPSYTVVRIDRKTALGNPFYMANENQRDYVCDQFEAHMKHKLKEPKGYFFLELKEIYQRVKAGEDIVLTCWCHPKRCHGDSIKNLIDAQLSRDNGSN